MPTLSLQLLFEIMSLEKELQNSRKRQKLIWLSSTDVPIYFQTVRGASASLSGVYLLPMILSILIAAVGSGILGKRRTINSAFPSY